MPRSGHQALLTDRVALSRQAQEFLNASIRRDRHRRSRLTVTLSALLAISIAAATTAYILRNGEAAQKRAAEAGQALATARLLLSQADTAFGNHDSLKALRLAEAADRIHQSPETQAGITAAL